MPSLLLGIVFAADEDRAPGEPADGRQQNCGYNDQGDAHHGTGKFKWVMVDSR